MGRELVTISVIGRFIVYAFTIAEPESLCWKRYQQNIMSGVTGSHIPWCRPDGSFSPLQIQSSQYFCVNNMGDEVAGTSVDISLGKPDCRAASTYRESKQEMNVCL